MIKEKRNKDMLQMESEVKNESTKGAFGALPKEEQDRINTSALEQATRKERTNTNDMNFLCFLKNKFIFFIPLSYCIQSIVSISYFYQIFYYIYFTIFKNTSTEIIKPTVQ